MKTIILRSLTMTNFRGEQQRTTTFQPEVTTIAGDNGLGKSRHFDAFLWLLFGKDQFDRKDFNVKSNDADGNPIPKTNTAVEAELLVDGEPLTLKRAYIEEWTKPRGQTELVFKGNKTECYWNEVPVNVSEYQRRIKEIVDDTAFKMITQPHYFPTMPWKEQREQLFLLAGTVSDEQLASSNKAFAGLLDRLSGKSFEDFKKEIAARKKRLKADLEQVQPRIDQTRHLMPPAIDTKSVQAQLDEVERELAKVNRAIADHAEQQRHKHEALANRQERLHTLQRQQQALLFKAEEQAQQQAHEQNAQRREIEAKIRDIEARKEAAHQQWQRAMAASSEQKNMTEACEAQAEALRQQWHSINAETYEGQTTCQCCHQPLPQAMIQEAERLWEEGKTARLGEINQKGQAIKEKCVRAHNAHLEAERDYAQHLAHFEQLDQQTRQLHEQLRTMPTVTAEKPKAESIEGWGELQKLIVEVQASIAQAETAGTDTDSTEAYTTMREQLTAKRDYIKAELAKQALAEKYTEEIENLEARGRELAQQIADIEKEEYVMYQFLKAKVDEAENRINALFTHVKFRLFTYNISDTQKENPIETCELLIDGVPYAVANSAGQVNAGLDVINALSRYYGVAAPIFIDNRERVNKIIATQSQIINLKVTDDKELVVS